MANLDPDLTNLDVGDWGQRLLTVGMLCGESQERCDTQSDSCWHRLGLDPETDPGHHDNQAGGDVGVEHEVAQPSPELELHHQTGEVAWQS